MVRLVAAWIAGIWMVAGAAVVQGGPSDAVVAAATVPPTTAGTTTTVALTTTTTSSTTVPATTTTEAPPPTEPPTTEAPPPPPPPTEPPTTVAAAAPLTPLSPWTDAPYRGLGTWVDVYDWSLTYGSGAVGLGDIDRMADLGVQTLFIQTGRADNPAPVLERDRLVGLIERAHARGMYVVGWFLPYLDDPDADLAHLLAAAQLPIDGLGVDIESRSVDDIAERNRRITDISAALRAQLPGQWLSAIVLPPVIMEDVNPSYWPGYPWAALAPYYDVWQPMDYWTFRTGTWRSAYAYTAVDIDRVRARIGNPSAPVHPIGGIGDLTTVADVGDMLQATIDRGGIGGSLYDYRTTTDELWGPLQGFRS